MDTEFPTALRAEVDQHQAAIPWARGLFPENAYVINNARVEEVVLDALGVTAAERGGGGSHVLVPSTGRAWTVGPDDDLLRALRAAAPRQSPCDYHGGEWSAPVALLPVVAPPHVVLLALCGRCIGLLDLNYPSARFVFIDPTPDSPERTNA